jgi:hypothetical protein
MIDDVHDTKHQKEFTRCMLQGCTFKTPGKAERDDAMA